MPKPKINHVSRFKSRQKKLLPVGTSNPVVTVASAKGSKIVDLNGKEYIDFISGIGVMAIGHSHKQVSRAVREQCEKFSHTCFGIVGYNAYLDLCKRLTNLFPHGSPDDTKVFLTNSGSDSIENAVKIARAYTRRSEIIAFTGAFHGRHYMAMTLTDKPGNRKYCGPFPNDTLRLQFPSYFHHGHRENRNDYLKQEITALKDSFKTGTNPEEVAAVILELVQGENGFPVMPSDYLAALKEICQQHGILIIVDEVQSGFGRTGKWGAYQHYQDIGFTPDLSTWAKAMGAGYPIGAVMGRREIMDGIPPGILGGTYLGNPVSCVAANAAIDYMEKVNLPDLANKRGKIIRNRLEGLYRKYDAIGEVRGLGAMLSIEFNKKRRASQPDVELCQDLITACREAGLLLIGAGLNKNVIRILCPLNIEIKTLKEGLDIMGEELKKLIEKNR